MFLPLNELKESSLVKVSHGVVIWVVNTSVMQSFFNLMYVQIKGLIRNVNVFANAHKLLELVLSREVSDQLADSFSDEWYRIGDWAASQNFARDFEGHVD